MTSKENLPRDKKRVSITVNGQNIQREIKSCMTLAEFLREGLNLTGTKVGCNRGECGSCTVLMSGKPVLSCTVLGVEASGKEVLTIEGLMEEGKLDALQQVFIEHDALQCGYCTSGMILATKALLERNPRPTRDEVRSAIDGNFCRCGSYPNIINAVLDVSRKTTLE